MINPSKIQLSSLPSVALEDRSRLPQLSGIYFAIDSQSMVQYIGRSSDIRLRWSDHHRCDDLKTIGGIKIAYLAVDLPRLLPDIELALITWFDPPLNIAGKLSLAVSDVEAKLKRVSEVKGFLTNKVKPFLESRGMSAYQFIKDTGIAPATGYKLAKSSSYLPGIRVLEAICDTYQIQPGDILEWTPGKLNGESKND